MQVDPKIEIADLLDLVIKAFALVGFCFAVYKYRADWYRDFKKKAYEQKMDCYWQIMELSAKMIHNTHGTVAYEEARQMLIQLLKGKVRIVQTRLLELAITRFVALMSNYHTEPSEFNKTKLDGGAYELAHLLRNDLASSWGVKFFGVEYRFVNPDDGSAGDSYLGLSTYRLDGTRVDHG